MSTPVDLRGLAIERNRAGQNQLRARRHVLTRYVIPLALMLGFFALMAWASWDIISPPTPVTVVPVYTSLADIRAEGAPLFKAAGWIQPRPTPVRIATLAPGVVEKLLVVEDQEVVAGQPIALLNKADAELALISAQADLELRQAELNEANAALTAAQTRLDQPVHLQAQVDEADASLAKIRTELTNLPFEIRRAKADYEGLLKDYEGKLAAKGVVAGVAIEIAKSKVDSARALIDQETKRLESLALEQAAMTARRDALNKRFELLADEIEAKGESAARVKAATARWTKARVAVDEAQLRLDRMSVVSPIDGRVYQLVANPGTTLSAGTGPIANTDGMTVATLYRPEMLQVRVDVRFEDIPKVALHQSVEIANPALAEPLIGRVLFVSSEANIQKNTLEVKVEIPDPPSVLKPEMLVDTTFLAPKPDVPDQDTARELKLYIPAILLGQEQNASFVWIADRTNGVARKIEIETGPAAQDGLVEVIRGLNVSNRLISSGRESLRDGDRIRITGEESATFVSQPNPNHQLSDDHATN